MRFALQTWRDYTPLKTRSIQEGPADHSPRGGPTFKGKTPGPQKKRDVIAPTGAYPNYPGAKEHRGLPKPKGASPGEKPNQGTATSEGAGDP